MHPSRCIACLAGALCALFLISATATAEVKITSKTIRAKGYGTTPQEAIQNAIVQAVQQHKGVHIDAKQLHTALAKSSSTVENGTESYSTSLNDRLLKQVVMATKGAVSNYSIINEGKGDDGLYWVEVETIFRSSEYVTPGIPNKRRTFAVYPFSAASRTFFVSGRSVSGIAVAEAVTDAIIAQLVQARKFAILQRRDFATYNAEKSIIASSDANHLERLKLGRVLGADYMLVGAVNNFNAGTTSKVSSLTGERLSSGSAEINLSYELMLMATQQIKWADTVNFRVELPSGAADDGTLQGVFDSLANTIVLDLLENIYPPQIVAVQGTSLQLNLGGKAYVPGDRLEVFSLGNMVVDPYTKEPLEPIETPVGTITITRITAKLAYAQADPDTIPEVGMICRRMTGRIQTDIDPRAKTNVKGGGSEGGVRLPFDK
jgi:TolB-like protein